METSDLIHLGAACSMAAIVAAIWMRTYWNEICLKLQLWWARVPWLGTIAAIARDPSNRAPHGKGGIATRGEVIFAGGFTAYTQRLAEAEFNNLVRFLAKAGDRNLNLRKAPIMLTVALVFAVPEAWLMAMSLISDLLGDLSANQKAVVAPILGYVLAILFIMFAHIAGERARIWRDARAHMIWVQERGEEQYLTPDPISPGDDQSKDDDKPSAAQYFARSAHGASLGFIVGMFLAPVVLSVAVCAVRLKNMEADLFPLTGEAVTIFVFLGMFIMVQVLGFVDAFRSAANAGKNAMETVRMTRGHSTYQADGREYARNLAQIEKVFLKLQARLRAASGRPYTPTFHEVLAERVRQQAHAVRTVVEHSVDPDPAPPVPVPPVPPAPAAPAAAAPVPKQRRTTPAHRPATPRAPIRQAPAAQRAASARRRSGRPRATAIRTSKVVNIRGTQS